MTDTRGIAERLYDQGTRLLSRVASRMLQEPRAQEWAARAVGAAQRGKQRFEQAEERLLHAAGIAARPDYEEVARRLARLKRRLREIAKNLERERTDQEQRRSRVRSD
jgi:hypothetical protein